MKKRMASAVMAMGMASVGLAQSNAPEAAKAPAAVPKTWVDMITLKGDIRYRYESINDDSALNASKENYTRQRDRIRARLGADAKVNDNVKVGVEMSTGQADPVSGNQSIGDGFAKKQFNLNLAYVDYNFFGDSPNEVHVVAGKMKNPFLAMTDDLVWDGDATPEGVALKSQLGEGLAKYFLNGGYLWVQERSNKADSMLYGGQGAVKFQFVPEVGLTVGASYYGFQNMQGYDVIDWEAKNNAYGNSTTKGTVSGSTTNKAWATEYTPMVYFAQVDIWAAGLPIAIFAQDLSNLDADSLDHGMMYGASIGKAKNPKTWELGYSYAELEKDATVGFLTDSDRWGGGTDGNGSRIYAKYQLMKNLQVAGTYLIGQKKISATETDYDRMQLDLVASF
jgi:hypothetical protein